MLKCPSLDGNISKLLSTLAGIRTLNLRAHFIEPLTCFTMLMQLCLFGHFTQHPEPGGCDPHLFI